MKVLFRKHNLEKSLLFPNEDNSCLLPRKLKTVSPSKTHGRILKYFV